MLEKAIMAITLPNAPNTEAMAQNQRVSSVFLFVAAQIVTVVTIIGTIKLRMDLEKRI
jgi:hypothetical protein